MRKTFFYIILFLSTGIFSQKQTTHWYFGETAGLDFTLTTPVADVNSSLATPEGCATISDVNGNLLFYTDGVTVWNRNHTVMPTGNSLLGSSTSSQSAMIIPKPNDDTIYYLFTIDSAGANRGLNYYIVDMTLDGGLGDVIGTVAEGPTVINLITPPTTEKVTAIELLDEDGVWVISFKQGAFFVFKVTNSGVNEIPIPGNSGFSGWSDVRGYLKISPDGSKMASANASEGIYIYDFNRITGVVSNERLLNVSGEFPYGVEFSPQGRKLYVTTGEAALQLERLYQFTVELPLPTSENINATRVLLHSYFNSRSALQLGLDRKIYRAIDETSFLGVINNPEADGLASNYVHNAISLGGKISRQGLPQFIQSYFGALISVENQCLGEVTSFTIGSNRPILSITWDFGDGSPTSTLLSPTNTYLTAGTYEVIAEVTTSESVETVSRFIAILDFPTINSPITLSQCESNTDGFAEFNLENAQALITSDSPTPTFTYFLTEINADTNTDPIEDPTLFSNETSPQVFVRVENSLGCYSIAELNLEVSTTAIPSDFMLNFNECDTTLIDDNDTNGITTFDFSSATPTILALFSLPDLVVTYYKNMEDALAKLSPIDPTNYRNEDAPFIQQIVVRVDSDGNACLGLGFHITLTVNPLPEFEVESPQYLCLNLLPNPLSITVENPQEDYSYEWENQDGIVFSSTLPILEVTEPGDYLVTAITDDNCRRSKMITVMTSNIAMIESIEVTGSLNNSTIVVLFSGEGDYEFSIDAIGGPYQDSPIFENVAPGVRTIYIRDKNDCGIAEELFSVFGFPRFFTPNNDSYNDTWQVLGLSSQLNPTTKIFIFDRFGKLLKQLSPFDIGWDGRYNGNKLPSSDYWFRVELPNGEVFKSHFTLKR